MTLLIIWFCDQVFAFKLVEKSQDNFFESAALLCRPTPDYNYFIIVVKVMVNYYHNAYK